MFNIEEQRELLRKKIEKHQPATALTVERILAEKPKDYILKLDPSLISFRANGKVKMIAGNNEFNLHPNAIQQTADKLGINSGYVRELVNSNEDWKKELISLTLNRYIENATRPRVLVRAVGNEVRGVLSDSYKRINSIDVFADFIQQSQANGLVPLDGYNNGLSASLTMVIPEIYPIETQKNGTLGMAFGVRLKNSDFGAATFELSQFIFQVVCYNGMISFNAIKEVHLGKRLPDNIEFAEETLRSETRTRSLMMRDALRQLTQRSAIERQISKMQAASNIVIDVQGKIKELKKDITKTEEAQIIEVITNNRPEDGVQGENTLLKFVQAIGKVGEKVENPERKEELDRLAYNLIAKEGRN